MINTIGPHRVRHGDLMQDLEGLIDCPVDMVYSDPPWGEGNLKYWGTMNYKMTGQVVHPADLSPFLERYFCVTTDALKPDGIMFLEYGLRWRPLILDFAKRFGLIVHGIAQPFYGSPKRPLDLFIMRKVPHVLQESISHGYVASIKGTSGYATLHAAAAPYCRPGMVVLDPCCGLGYTARLAINYQMKFIGNELNSARLEKTILKLRAGL